MYSYTKNATSENFTTQFPLLGGLCVPSDIEMIGDNGEIERGLLLEFDARLITAENMNDLSANIAATKFFGTSDEWNKFRNRNGFLKGGLE